MQDDNANGGKHEGTQTNHAEAESYTEKDLDALEDEDEDSDFEDDPKIRELLKELAAQAKEDLEEAQEHESFEGAQDQDFGDAMHSLYQSTDPLNQFFVEKEQKLLALMASFFQLAKIAKALDKLMTRALDALTNNQLSPKLRISRKFTTLLKKLIIRLQQKTQSMFTSVLMHLRRLAGLALKSVEISSVTTGQGATADVVKLMRALATFVDRNTGVSIGDPLASRGLAAEKSGSLRREAGESDPKKESGKSSETAAGLAKNDIGAGRDRVAIVDELKKAIEKFDNSRLGSLPNNPVPPNFAASINAALNPVGIGRDPQSIEGTIFDALRNLVRTVMGVLGLGNSLERQSNKMERSHPHAGEQRNTTHYAQNHPRPDAQQTSQTQRPAEASPPRQGDELQAMINTMQRALDAIGIAVDRPPPAPGNHMTVEDLAARVYGGQNRGGGDGV